MAELRLREQQCDYAFILHPVACFSVEYKIKAGKGLQVVK
jgi:hypothetical protein